MADESGEDGVLECEAIRNALAASGISPHHIVMDCSAVRYLLLYLGQYYCPKLLTIENSHVALRYVLISRA